MMVMFIKHSYSISDEKQKQIEQNFLLVFSKLDELGEINEERLKLYSEQLERDKEDKKQRIYRQIADDQIKNLISMMNDFPDERNSINGSR